MYCAHCHKGMLNDQGLAVSDDWEERIRKKYSNLPVCNTSKNEILMAAIKRGAAKPWDLPGHEHTNNNL